MFPGQLVKVVIRLRRVVKFQDPPGRIQGRPAEGDVRVAPSGQGDFINMVQSFLGDGLPDLIGQNHAGGLRRDGKCQRDIFSRGAGNPADISLFSGDLGDDIAVGAQIIGIDRFQGSRVYHMIGEN